MSKSGSNLKKLMIWLSAALLSVWLLAIIGWFVFIHGNDNQIKLGAMGDAFAVINTLFSGAAFLAFIYALLLQKKDLQNQYEELRLSRKEYSLYRITSIVYNELDYIESKINGYKITPKQTGTEALRVLSSEISHLISHGIDPQDIQGAFKNIRALISILETYNAFYSLVVEILIGKDKEHILDNEDKLLLARLVYSKRYSDIEDIKKRLRENWITLLRKIPNIKPPVAKESMIVLIKQASRFYKLSVKIENFSKRITLNPVTISTNKQIKQSV